MVCCKAKEFGWCREEDVVYTDPDTGEEYCLFHAPAEHKGVGEEEFTARVFGLLRRAKKGHRECNLSGAVFPWDIHFTSFDHENPLPKITFDKASFSGMAGFYRASFSGAAWFDRASFSGAAWFGSATFCNDARFDEATFNGVARFDSAIFSRNAQFHGVTFNRNAVFQRTTFGQKANFDSITFVENVFFHKVVFQNAQFKYCKFKGQVDYKCASFVGQADFTNTEFNHKADFIGTFFGAVDFGGCLSEKPILLDRVDLSYFRFSDLDVERFRFRDCFWPEKDGRPVILDELEACQKDEEKGGKEPLARAMRWKRLEEIYRQLKRKAKDEHNESLAGDWHYREKFMALRARIIEEKTLDLLDQFEAVIPWAGNEAHSRPPEKSTAQWWTSNIQSYSQNILKKVAQWGRLFVSVPFPTQLSVTWWYWTMAGFGERPGRAFAALIGLALLLLPLVPESWLFGLPLYKIPEGHGSFFGWFAQLALSVQATLTAFALRNKFRR